MRGATSAASKATVGDGVEGEEGNGNIPDLGWTLEASAQGQMSQVNWNGVENNGFALHENPLKIPRGAGLSPWGAQETEKD